MHRGSRDGFKGVDFHAKFDGVPNTLTLILSEYDKIFGGFTEVKWGSQFGNMADAKAYIFSVTER